MTVILLDEQLGIVVRAARCDSAHDRVTLATTRLQIGALALDCCTPCAENLTRIAARYGVPATATEVDPHPLTLTAVD